MTLTSDKNKLKQFVEQLDIQDKRRKMNHDELQQLRYYFYIETRKVYDEHGKPTGQRYYPEPMRIVAAENIRAMQKDDLIGHDVETWLGATDKDYGGDDDIVTTQSHIDLTHEQYLYIQRRFYQATSLSGHTKLFMRRQTEQLSDLEQNVVSALDVISAWSFATHKTQSVGRLISEAFRSLVPTVTAQEYCPNGDLLVRHDFAPYANTWVRPTVVYDREAAAMPTERPPLWQEYLDRMFPPGNKCWWGVEGDAYYKEMEQQDYMEAWLAQRVCNPEQTNTTAIVLRGEQGTGKGFWMDTLALPMIGRPNIQAVKTKDWNGQFNGDMFQSVIIHLEETKDTRTATADMLKSLVTQPVHRANTKNMPQRQVTKHFAIVISSNHLNPIAIEKGDRRYFVPVWSVNKVHKDETHNFIKYQMVEWLEKHNGFQVLRNWLQQVDTDKIDFETAPMTKEKADIWTEVSVSESRDAQIGAWMKTMDEGQYLLTSFEVQEYWRISHSDAQNYMKAGGYKVKRMRITGSDKADYVWLPTRLYDVKPTRLQRDGWRLWDRRKEGHFEITAANRPDFESETPDKTIDTSQWSDLEKNIWDKLQMGITVPVNMKEVPNIIQTKKYVYCGRPSNTKLTYDNWKAHFSWGNPFEIGQRHPDTGEQMTRDDVIQLHKEKIPHQKVAEVYQLKGKALGCFCKPKACHCDYLAELANGLPTAID